MRGDGRPAGAAAAVPARRRRHVVLPEAGARERARLARRRRSSARRTAPTSRRAGGRPTSPTSCGRSTSAASASTSGRRAPTTPSTPTSCASTSIPRRASTSTMVREAAARGRARCSTSSASSACPKTTGNRGHPRLRPARSRAGTPYQVRAAAVARGPRAGAPPPRPDHRRVVEGGARRARLHRLQPERAAQDDLRRVVGARRGRARRCRRRSRWDELDTIDPDALTIATVPARVAERGDPWAAMTTSRSRSSRCSTMHERDRAAGLLDAPWPPVYPKMPGEPPRVAPSRARKGSPP